MMLALPEVSCQQKDALGSGNDDRIKKRTDPFAMVLVGYRKLQARFLIPWAHSIASCFILVPLKLNVDTMYSIRLHYLGSWFDVIQYPASVKFPSASI